MCKFHTILCDCNFLIALKIFIICINVCILYDSLAPCLPTSEMSVKESVKETGMSDASTNIAVIIGEEN